MRSVDRALDVLYLLAHRSAPVTAKEIAAELDLPKSTTHHLLNVMAERNFVSYLPDQREWALGVAAFEVGSAFARSGQLVVHAQRFMPALAGSTGATAHLAVLQGTDVVYLEKREPLDHAVRLVTDVGARLPAHLTAVGRALLSRLDADSLDNLYEVYSWKSRTGVGPSSLAELREILAVVQADGYAVEHSTTTSGIDCVAAPILTRSGTAVAALGIAYLAVTKSEQERTDAIRVVVDLSSKFSASLDRSQIP
jgi:DNA-binding IclR family transcriptional regulator